YRVVCSIKGELSARTPVHAFEHSREVAGRADAQFPFIHPTRESKRRRQAGGHHGGGFPRETCVLSRGNERKGGCNHSGSPAQGQLVKSQLAPLSQPDEGNAGRQTSPRDPSQSERQNRPGQETRETRSRHVEACLFERTDYENYGDLVRTARREPDAL